FLRFHAVYWPAFLMSAGLRLPSQVQAHGWLTINGEKMSKSLGNFLPPVPLAEAVGVDVLRYYLMREVGFGQDGDFSHKNLVARYNGELANGLGNLLNRILPFVEKHFGGVVQPLEEPGELEQELRAAAVKAANESNRFLEDVLPHRALDSIWELVAVANRYVDRTEPWRLSKTGDEPALARCTTAVIEALATVSVMAWPFMPGKCDALRAQIGLPPVLPDEGKCLWPFQPRESA